MRNIITGLTAITLIAASSLPTLAQNAASGESDYWRTTDVDYSVFKKDQPINNKGLFEVDKKTGKQTQLSKDFQKGVEIYQQAKPVIDLVGGIFGLGGSLGFLKHIDNNLEYGEWLFGKVPREQQAQEQQAQGTEANGAPLGDVYGVDGKVDPTKAREQALSTIEANADIKADSPFGVSRTMYKLLVGDLAVTRAARKNLELMFGEAGQQFAKEAREYSANVVKTSGQMVDQALEAKSTQDVNKIRAQIAANGQLLDQVQFAEQQQTRFSVDRVNDAVLTQLELKQQEKWDKEQDEASADIGLAQVRQLTFSMLHPSGSESGPSNQAAKVSAQQNPSFIRK
ncbi:hypothetical protein [Acaryochloris marina]|uniref:Uncharacterized protein n=1 Tax=Acaryochloris marina (strain MBIC 11017) TaxID=329726 RepID=A8ZNE8_ACAM1|nr:hypothetical protein [Acaryochloris marina]ABW32534.1 hypothetical protein AM1_D0037 [Acaryochloris marina MBIC11017]